MSMKKEIRNKSLRIICIVAAAVIAVALILFGIFEYTAKYKIDVIDSFLSFDGNFELMFQSVGEPDWPFGPSHARFVLKCNGEVLTKYKLDVFNDGKNLCDANWQVLWKDRSVEVLIIGEEQEDVLYSLTFDGDVKIKADNQL